MASIYRLHDAAGRTLYVGQTWGEPDQRRRQHVNTKPWGHLIAGVDVLATVDTAFRNEINHAEGRFIRLLDPPHNRQREFSDRADRDLPPSAPLVIECPWPPPRHAIRYFPRFAEVQS